MKTQFRTSFVNDLERIRDYKLLERIKQVIQRVEDAHQLQDIPHVKKLHARQATYRIRVGEYRLGIVMEGPVVTFIRCLNRKDIYRYFP